MTVPSTLNMPMSVLNVMKDSTPNGLLLIATISVPKTLNSKTVENTLNTLISVNLVPLMETSMKFLEPVPSMMLLDVPLILLEELFVPLVTEEAFS